MTNPLSYSSLKLDIFSKEGAPLKSASGFVIEAGNQHFLITNWHVVTGRSIDTPDFHEPDGEPYTLQTSIHIVGGEGEHSFPLSWGVWKRLTLQLYGDNVEPAWIEGLANKQNQPIADIVALPFALDLNLASLVSKNFLRSDSDTSYWSKISAIPVSAIDTEMEYGPPDTVHTIGYPLDWAPGGPGKSSTAFWRTSTIASEINKIDLPQANVFFIDPCALEGMTGSPVVGMKSGHVKLLGVYSDNATTESGANAGMVWDASLVKELLGIS